MFNIKLSYDLNYERGYSQYQGQDIICIGYPFGEKVSCGSGKIININDFEFEHNCPTEVGSSGSPVIIFQTKQVIGIHKHGNLEKKINVGTFIGNEIFKEIKNDIKKENNAFNKKEDSSKKVIFNENYNDNDLKKDNNRINNNYNFEEKNNYIIGEINIGDDDINK